MASPDTDWIVTEPGVMELAGTKFQIKFNRHSLDAYQVFWDGKLIPRGTYMKLSIAKQAVTNYMQELITMGFEV